MLISARAGIAQTARNESQRLRRLIPPSSAPRRAGPSARAPPRPSGGPRGDQIFAGPLAADEETGDRRRFAREGRAAAELSGWVGLELAIGRRWRCGCAETDQRKRHERSIDAEYPASRRKGSIRGRRRRCKALVREATRSRSGYRAR